MKKLYYFPLFYLITLSVWCIDLPSDWVSAELPAPTIFSANQYKDKKKINSISIFSIDSSAKGVVSLKEKLKANNLKTIDDKYLVTGYKTIVELKNAYQIEVKNIKTHFKFTQIWKFGEKKTMVSQVTNFVAIDKEIKKQIFKQMEE